MAASASRAGRAGVRRAGRPVRGTSTRGAAARVHDRVVHRGRARRLAASALTRALSACDRPCFGPRCTERRCPGISRPGTGQRRGLGRRGSRSRPVDVADAVLDRDSVEAAWLTERLRPGRTRRTDERQRGEGALGELGERHGQAPEGEQGHRDEDEHGKQEGLVPGQIDCLGHTAAQLPQVGSRRVHGLEHRSTSQGRNDSPERPPPEGGAASRSRDSRGSV